MNKTGSAGESSYLVAVNTSGKNSASFLCRLRKLFDILPPWQKMTAHKAIMLLIQMNSRTHPCVI